MSIRKDSSFLCAKYILITICVAFFVVSCERGSSSRRKNSSFGVSTDQYNFSAAPKRHTASPKKQPNALESLLPSIVETANHSASPEEIVSFSPLCKKLERAQFFGNIPQPIRRYSVETPYNVTLRRNPTHLTSEEIENAVHRYHFPEKKLNPEGCFFNQFFSMKIGEEWLQIDGTTQLMWTEKNPNKSESMEPAESYTHAEAIQAIKSLNQNRYAGYADWRLPTLEEALSLLLSVDRNFAAASKDSAEKDSTFSPSSMQNFFHFGDTHEESFVWTSDSDTSNKILGIDYNSGQIERTPINSSVSGEFVAVRLLDTPALIRKGINEYEGMWSEAYSKKFLECSFREALKYHPDIVQANAIELSETEAVVLRSAPTHLGHFALEKALHNLKAGNGGCFNNEFVTKNNTVIDNKTNLVWALKFRSVVPESKLNGYIAKLNAHSKQKWRFPTLEELSSLFEYVNPDFSSASHIPPVFKLSGTTYIWSCDSGPAQGLGATHSNSRNTGHYWVDISSGNNFIFRRAAFDSEATTLLVHSVNK